MPSPLAVEADGRTTLFEFSLLQVVERYLRPRPAGADGHIMSYGALAEEIGMTLSLVAHSGSNDPAMIQRAFATAASQLDLIRDRLALEPTASFSPRRLTRALAQLDRAAPPIKRQLIEALARAAAADQVIMPAEVEILRAVAAAVSFSTIRVPLFVVPPLGGRLVARIPPEDGTANDFDTAVEP